MKKLSILLLLISINLMSQTNLVPNPSFEFTTNCPTSSIISNATGWLSFTDSPDYFNICAPNPSPYNVPVTFAGYQQPFHGNAFVGILVNSQPLTANAREYFGIQLTQTLTIGQKYYASFRIALGDPFRNCWSNKIGLRFTTYYNNLPQWSTGMITNFSHIKTDSLLKDTTNWTLVKGSFIADSAYKYVVFGNFYNDANTDTLNCDNTWYTYSFFDMVSVSTDSLIGFGIQTSILDSYEQRSSFSIYPNPANKTLSISTQENDFMNLEIKIIDKFGNELYQSHFINEIDVSFLNNGIYFCILKFKNGRIETKKIIISH